MKTTPPKIRPLVAGLLFTGIFTACVPPSTPPPKEPPASPPTETPQPRETPDQISAFAGPILLAIQDRPPDFQDDFSQSASEWVSATGGEEPLGTIAIADGALTMNVESGQYPMSTRLGMGFENFVLQVDVDLQQLEGDKEAQITWGSGYFFGLYPMDGSGWELGNWGLQEPISFGAAPVDFSEPVTITIIAEGTEIAVYLNGTPLTYFDDTERRPITSTIRIGLWSPPPIVESHSITYDNLRTWNLDSVFPPSWATQFSDPILLAIQDRPPDFQDDFSQDTNGWLTRENAPQDLGNVAVANGGLMMNPRPGISGHADHHSTSIRDFVVQVDVKFLDSSPQRGVRLEWLRYEAYDATMTIESFNTYGDYSWQLRACSPVNPNDPECQEGLPYGDVSVDLSESNTITILSKGTELAVYLNGTPLTYYNFLGRPAASHVRLESWDPSEDPGHLGIVFDNFKIWELQPLFPPPAPDPALGIGSSMERPVDGMVMMYVPEGEFLMGSDTGDPNSQPVRAVYLDPFWIDRTEVTYDMFARFLSEVGNQTDDLSQNLAPDHPGYGAPWFNPEGSGNVAHIFPVPGGSAWQAQRGYGELPATTMNWYGAQAYCAWAGGGRLPTEAEWEKAARGGLEGRLYPWGDEPPTCTLGASNGAWIGVPCGRMSIPMSIPPVGSYAPNGYGLYDMLGSVIEWTAGWYSPTYYAFSPYRNPLGAREDWTGEQEMPLHPSIANFPETGLDELGIASRNGWPAWSNRDNRGFRCARSP